MILRVAAGRRYMLFAVFTSMLSVAPAEARPSIDVIRFKNGDKWTCEIKKLDHGYLYVGLDYVDGTVNVDWSKIESVESSQLFVVTDANGVIHEGTISTSSNEASQTASLTIGSGASRSTILKSRVSSIQETEPKFWQDFHGGVSAGLNFAKSNSQTQYNMNANLNYVKSTGWRAASFNPLLVVRFRRPATCTTT